MRPTRILPPPLNEIFDKLAADCLIADPESLDWLRAGVASGVVSVDGEVDEDGSFLGVIRFGEPKASDKTADESRTR